MANNQQLKKMTFYTTITSNHISKCGGEKLSGRESLDIFVDDELVARLPYIGHKEAFDRFLEWVNTNYVQKGAKYREAKYPTSIYHITIRCDSGTKSESIYITMRVNTGFKDCHGEWIYMTDYLTNNEGCGNFFIRPTFIGTCVYHKNYKNNQIEMISNSSLTDDECGGYMVQFCQTENGQRVHRI